MARDVLYQKVINADGQPVKEINPRTGQLDYKMQAVVLRTYPDPPPDPPSDTQRIEQLESDVANLKNLLNNILSRLQTPTR
jgi:hypothetical protein